MKTISRPRSELDRIGIHIVIAKLHELKWHQDATAKHFNVSPMAISIFIKKHPEIRPQSQCPFCPAGVLFTPRRSNQKVCDSEECAKARSRFHNLKTASKPSAKEKRRLANKRYLSKPEVMDRRRRYFRERYKTDPEYREGKAAINKRRSRNSNESPLKVAMRFVAAIRSAATKFIKENAK